MIGELHDELLPHHACGAKDADVYSAGNHNCSFLNGARTRVRRARRREGEKKTRRLLSVGGLLNLG